MVDETAKELLEEKSGGRMTLEVYYSSSLTGVGSTLDGIKNGTVDMGYDACGFYGAVFPYTELFSVLCLYFGDSYEASKVLREFDAAFTDEVLDDYHIMARFIGETMCMFVKDADPIKSPADVAGKTFRTTGSNQALVEACGGAGQGMPSADVYEALRLNVIDGAITPPVGSACYIVSGVCEGVTLQSVFRGSLPFVISYLCMAVLMIFLPGIAAFLSGLMR